MQLARSLVLVLALLLPVPALGQSDAEAVRSVFASYRSAILAGHGAEAAGLLSQSTYDYYEELRRLALAGDAETVKAQSLVNRFQILLLRLRVPTDQLASLSSRELIARAVDEEWLGKVRTLELEPGDVLADGDVATLGIAVPGGGATPGFRFQREAGQWRLDLRPTLQVSNVALQMTARQRGLDENAFVFSLLESLIGRKVGAEAWVPPQDAAIP